MSFTGFDWRSDGRKITTSPRAFLKQVLKAAVSPRFLEWRKSLTFEYFFDTLFTFDHVLSVDPSSTKITSLGTRNVLRAKFVLEKSSVMVPDSL
jgi:hypothetical protein